MAQPSSGRVVVISGPAGAGKTTVLKELFACSPRPLVSSVSATTRSHRPGEVDGVDYHFLSTEEFTRRREAGEFLECFEVFGLGHWYGTLWSEVTPRLSEGKWVVLEIDVHGARVVLERYPDAITIFLRPESMAELERRLRARKTETEAAIQRRLEVARQELAEAGFYRHHVINDTLDQAVREIVDILNASGD